MYSSVNPPTLSYSFRIPPKLHGKSSPRKMSAFTTTAQRQLTEKRGKCKQQHLNRSSTTTAQKECRRQRTMKARATWTGAGHDEGSTTSRLLQVLCGTRKVPDELNPELNCDELVEAFDEVLFGTMNDGLTPEVLEGFGLKKVPLG
ncbi:hypothetical protein niasHS_016808 [Heterodera schachtii]|uniref:Uncharacterized protein n=1 Tax=Heterodera schachtii TaxID=97005 RepID=A0ABD2HPI3_HETSC